jgi:hypothetical protein
MRLAIGNTYVCMYEYYIKFWLINLYNRNIYVLQEIVRIVYT